MLASLASWLGPHRGAGRRCLHALGAAALGYYLAACAGGAAMDPAGTGGTGGAAGSGGSGGRGGTGQPAPTLTIQARALDTGLPIDAQHLKPGALADIVVTLTPIREAEIRFALLSSGSPPLDAVLSGTDVPLDLATGRANVTLTAPSVPAVFQVRASTSGVEPVLLDVAVDKSGFASLAVKPIHDPPRTITTWLASAWENKTCTDLMGSPPDDGPHRAESTTWPFELKVPSDVPVAVLVRAEKFAWGCTSISAAKEGPMTPVEVVLSNVPIKLDGSEFEFTLNLDANGFTAFEAGLAPYATAITDRVLGGAGDDVEALLEAMEREAETHPTFADVRTSMGWDALVRAELGAAAPDVLRGPLSAWLSEGVAALRTGGGIVAKLEGSADEAPVITLKSVFGLSVTHSTFDVVGDASLDVDAADGMLIGAGLEFQPEGLLLGAARAVAIAAVDGTSALSEALTLELCPRVAATLVANGETTDHAAGDCDEECALKLCSDAVGGLLDPVEDTTASFDVALDALAIVGKDAELLGFCSGAWLGSLLFTPDDPEAMKTSVVGDANGEPLTTDGSDPCPTRSVKP
jgi:hypothetical protein